MEPKCSCSARLMESGFSSVTVSTSLSRLQASFTIFLHRSVIRPLQMIASMGAHRSLLVCVPRLTLVHYQSLSVVQSLMPSVTLTAACGLAVPVA